ncbi:tRNA pseudouridine(55) synthase TruB [Pontibacillus yanchengensis]|uniref:tRNA pseudouridine(55) synthase TruB n=2 Tax=Pontibacillus yanchengensis TaxID=462910 RepID=A0ACC7VB80_9BACI|nr:tRNA pseudouridine(55) synthase TruB [Pontibacillus yanchengensis]MYL33188.1 tRNA pseudouridine(55) synthase TruB [Pontibacillus yanchengensis]MYL51962.1 tRNA pseudouridine(55) synthase TruB [Pontibacillus yanchengensis]
MDGILPLWKPTGITSHDCVMKIRKLLHTKKVGHTGTLDPDVEGMLPICLGMATKISSYVTESEKVYEATLKLGYSTETEDNEGAVVERKKVDDSISPNDIQKALHKFEGTITQVPPLYSAVRVQGKRLYEYAREGISVERPSRTVTIYNIELISNHIEREEETASFRIRITCSKGTYIRTLCVDIGRALGYPAHMSYLVRTASGSFEKEEAVTFEELEKAIEENNLNGFLKPMERGVRHLSHLHIPPEDEKKVYHGTVFPKPNPIPETNPFCMMNEKEQVLAIYQIHPDKPHLIKPVRVFQYE